MATDERWTWAKKTDQLGIAPHHAVTASPVAKADR